MNGKKRRMFALARRYRYAAAHTLRSPRLSAAENVQLYGPCAHPSGHGHDYQVEVILTADALRDDVLFGHGQLDDLVAEHVTPRLAYRDLDSGFGPEFITTGENLAAAIHGMLRPHVPGMLDVSIHLVETEKNSFAFHGEAT
ncbi:MAG: 6-carboxytetrahydropterin synthase [Candidatus Zixiibacteriota bacterium]